MSLRTILLLALSGSPYAWLGVRWSACLSGVCQLDGHLLFYTLVALVALPFLLAIIGWSLALGGARRLAGAASKFRAGSKPDGPVMEGARGSLRLWLGAALMLATLPVCAAILAMMLDTPEPGRDRLGRICETSGGSTTCRPDPNRKKPSTIDMLNETIKR